MTGRPQRSKAKVVLQATVDKAAYTSVLSLKDSGVFSSYSQLVESVLLLIRCVYIEDRNDALLRRLSRIKAARQLQISERKSLPEQRRLKATVDCEAMAFLDMLKTRHGELFSSKSEIVNLALYNIGEHCSKPDETAYISRRLLDVQESFR